MYLRPDEIGTTLQQLRQLYPTHVLICDLMNRRFYEKFGRRIHEKIAALGTQFTPRPDFPESIFLEHGYAEIDRTSMFRHAHELGLLKKRLRMPRLVSRLLLDYLQRDLNAYAVYRFRTS
jgi:ATP-dependent DNA ligase